MRGFSFLTSVVILDNIHGVLAQLPKLLGSVIGVSYWGQQLLGSDPD
jgi:hypothetical protein